MAPDVFLSHSVKDARVATKICDALETAGMQVWMAPRNVTPGAKWAGEITQAIHGCRVMVVIFSGAANASDQVLREVELAVAKGLTIVPFRIEPVEPSDSMEYFLATPHWLDAYGAPLEVHLPRLIASVRRALELPADVRGHELAPYISSGGVPVPAFSPGRRLLQGITKGSRWVEVAIAVIAAGALIGAGTWIYQRAETNPDDDVVAVLPFRVSANDPSVAYLREGMMDLLHDKFPRAVSVANVLNEWRRAGGHDDIDLPQETNLRVARNLRAGKLVVGSVLRTPQGIKMTARLLEVGSGAQRATASAEGPQNDYPALVDTVANELLTQQAGEQQHLYLLQRLPTSAVSAYVLGKRSYRAGKYDEAVTYFERALDSSRVAPDSESTFGLAALGLLEASNYEQVKTETGERGLRIAWAGRARFNARDRAFLDAAAGPDYPIVSTRLAQIRAWDRALNLIPNEPEAYFQFGDQLFQFGNFVQWEGSLELARNSLEQAVQNDSSFMPAVQRLAELSIVTGNLKLAEELLKRLPAGDSGTDRAGFLRWRLALAHNDSRELADVRRRFPQFSWESAAEIWLVSQLEGIAVDDGERALGVLRSRATRREDRASVAAGEYMLAMNQGRPARGLIEVRKSIPEDEPYFEPLIQGTIIRDAMFAGGDGAAAVDAVSQMSQALKTEAVNPEPTAIDMAAEYVQRCALEEWRLYHGNSDSAAATVRRLRAILPVILPRRFGGSNTAVAAGDRLCPVAVEAWAAVLQNQPDAKVLVDRLDSTMVLGPMSADGTIGNLLVARLRLAEHDTAKALLALRRRSYSLSSLFYLAPSLRDEGRLAAATGDRSGAIRAYTHYLALRSSPEPALRHEVDEVRAALNALQVIAGRDGCGHGCSAYAMAAPKQQTVTHSAIASREESRRMNASTTK